MSKKKEKSEYQKAYDDTEDCIQKSIMSRGLRGTVVFILDKTKVVKASNSEYDQGTLHAINEFLKRHEKIVKECS